MKKDPYNICQERRLVILECSNSRTSNENAVCAECGTCVFNSNHDACVSRYLKDVNARTKKPNVVPISASKPKRKANKSVATPHKKTVASDTTIQKSKSYYKELYENTNQEWKWWIAKRCPSGYTWTQKPLRTKKIWMPKVRKDDASTSISPTIDIVSRITNIVQLILFIVDSGCTKHMTGNLKLLCNFVEKFLGTVRFGNDQFALILGYGDLIQGNVMIKRVYYVEGLNHNLFSVGQFCDADLEVAFRKSTCFVRDLQGNDLLTGSRGSDLYTISLQETTSSTPICFMAKASPTQACANHDECVLEYLSRLNPRASAQNKDAKSHKTTKRYMPVEKSSASKKPETQIPTGHRFSKKKTTGVPEKTMTPRSCLRWQPTGRILKTVCLRWVPTGKLLNSCTGKVENEPTHGSNVDIPHIHACKQTLGLSAAVQASVVNVKWRLLKITLQAPFLNVQMMSVHISSGLVLHQMTSDHNRSELGIQDHSNEQSSSKLVPKVVPLAVKTATSRQELELLFHHHIAMLRTTGK
ncbi:hypothetical protein Tco_0033734 [Tanacetum coccineum]